MQSRYNATASITLFLMLSVALVADNKVECIRLDSMVSFARCRQYIPSGKIFLVPGERIAVQGAARLSNSRRLSRLQPNNLPGDHLVELLEISHTGPLLDLRK